MPLCRGGNSLNYILLALFWSVRLLCKRGKGKGVYLGLVLLVIPLVNHIFFGYG